MKKGTNIQIQNKTPFHDFNDSCLYAHFN